MFTILLEYFYVGRILLLKKQNKDSLFHKAIKISWRKRSDDLNTLDVFVLLGEVWELGNILVHFLIMVPLPHLFSIANK